MSEKPKRESFSVMSNFPPLKEIINLFEDLGYMVVGIEAERDGTYCSGVIDIKIIPIARVDFDKDHTYPCGFLTGERAPPSVKDERAREG
jgi:hypothetical protein